MATAELNLVSELKATRETVEADRAERDAVEREMGLKSGQYEAECERTAGLATQLQNPLADALGREVSELGSRLRTVQERLVENKKRLAALEALVTAENGGVEAARQAVKAAAATVADAKAKLAANEAAIERMASRQAEEVAAAQAARVQADAKHLGTLSEVDRADLGVQPVDPNAPVGDAFAHEAAARAFGVAIDREERARDANQAGLLAAQQAEQEASEAWMKQLCLASEAQHARELARYLPAWTRYQALHESVYGFRPEAPDIKRIAHESGSEALATVRREAMESIDEGLLRRGIRRLAAAAGL